MNGFDLLLQFITEHIKNKTFYFLDITAYLDLDNVNNLDIVNRANKKSPETLTKMFHLKIE